MQYYTVVCALQCYFLQTMQYVVMLTRYAQFLFDTVILMDFIYAGDDIERVGLSIIFFILHPVDLWPNSESQGHFWTCHLPISALLHIYKHN